jgi:hypothetical protein
LRWLSNPIQVFKLTTLSGDAVVLSAGFPEVSGGQGKRTSQSELTFCKER